MPKTKGNWLHSKFMLYAAVAKEWGMTPGQFKKLSDEDKAMMIAYEETKAEMRAADDHIREEKARREKRKKR